MVEYHKDYRWIENVLLIGGRRIGRVIGNVFHQFGTGQEHHLHSPPAWCLDVRAVEALEQMGVLFVERGELRANVTDFRIYGFRVDRDHGTQIGLADRYWYPKDAQPRPLQMQML